MGKYKGQLLLISLIVIPFSIINFSAYSKGNMPSVFQAITSMIFIVVWIIFGFISSNRSRDFMLAATVFWLTGAALLTIGYFGNVAIIYIPASIVWAGPVYGVRYFWDLNANVVFALVSVLGVYALSIAAALLGRNLRSMPKLDKKK